MLVILINWLYIGITTFFAGYAILGLFARLFEYKVRHMESYFLAGLAGVTVYAQVFPRSVAHTDTFQAYANRTQPSLN